MAAARHRKQTRRWFRREREKESSDLDVVLTPYEPRQPLRRQPVMLHRCRTGTALVGLDASLRILIEPQERGRPVVVTNTEALIRAIDSCEAARERVLAATEAGLAEQPDWLWGSSAVEPKTLPPRHSGNTSRSVWPIRFIRFAFLGAACGAVPRYAFPSTVMLRCEGAGPPVMRVCSLRWPRVACQGFSPVPGCQM